MTRIEIPTSVTFYVQWTLHPFAKPQVPEHRSANSKWALAQTKKLLKTNSIESDEVKIGNQLNGKVLLQIVNPDRKGKEGQEFWKEVLEYLTKSNDIESISVFVNNDTSETIAINLADRVPLPWHQGYQGQNNTTLIYHK